MESTSQASSSRLSTGRIIRVLTSVFGTVIPTVVLIAIFINVSDLTGDEVEATTIRVLIILAFIALFSALLSQLLSGNGIVLNSRQWWADFAQGLSTEMLGAIMTGLLFIFIVNPAEELTIEQNIKSDLILDLGSPDNATARNALRRIQARNWLTDGTLQNAVLDGANLSSANMRNANLRGATLNLANLERIILTGTDLRETRFNTSNLIAANLRSANLRDAQFEGANLGAVNFTEANLLGVVFNRAIFTADTTLPDGTKWIPPGTTDATPTDMTRFTDPNHPEFWRSSTASSPASG